MEGPALNLGVSVLCRGLGRDHGSVVTIVHLRGGWTSQPQFVKFANALWEPSGGEVYKRNVRIMKGVMAKFPLTSALLTPLTVLAERVGVAEQDKCHCPVHPTALGVGLISALVSQIPMSPTVNREKPVMVTEAGMWREGRTSLGSAEILNSWGEMLEGQVTLQKFRNWLSCISAIPIRGPFPL